MIYLGTDHAGLELKDKIKDYLAKDLGLEVKDLGAFKLEPEDDYPDFIFPVAQAVAKDPEAKGIIFGGSGQGEAMAANRVPGVRATVYYGNDKKIIKLSREHNNANVLSIGARFISEEDAKKAIKLWLDTDFNEEERHVRRIKKLDNQ